VPPDDPPRRDPGRAAERTRLAWARTAIGFAAVGAAALRREPVAGLVVLAITPLIWALGRLASRQSAPETRSRQLLLVTIAVTFVAAVAVVIALLGSGPASLEELLPRHG